MNISDNQTQLFNTHEKWGILIAILCFTAGFPSNLLSILVCFTSLLKTKPTKINNKASFKPLKPKIQSSKKGIDEADENFLLKHKTTVSSTQIPNNNTLNGRLSTFNQVVNPHRKCFELYLIEISICDLIILTYHLIEWILLILSRYNLIDKLYSEPILISQFMCRFIIALNRTVILLHNWLVALLALTRCYAIYKPLNSHIFLSSKFYCRLNLSILFVLLLFFITGNIFGVAMLTYSKTAINETTTTTTTNIDGYKIECKFKEELYNKYKYLDVYTNLAIGIIGYSLPIIITLIINIALIINLRHLLLHKTNFLRRNTFNSRSKPERSLHDLEKYDLKEKNLNRIKFFKTTGSLLFISISYLICYIPFTLVFLLFSLDKLNMNNNLIFGLTNLRYLNHTLNFFIYYASGKRFRNDVKAFFKIRRN
jgi:hypothetical protein